VTAFRSGGWGYSCARSIRTSWAVGSFGVRALTSKSTTQPSTCSRARNSAAAPSPRFSSTGCLFGGASRTPIAPWIFPCSRSCATMGSRIIWPRRCYSPMARFIWRLGPRDSLGAFAMSKLKPSNRSSLRLRGSPKSARCGEPRAICSIPMSATAPASVFSPARFGGAMPKRSMRPSGCPLCAASPCLRILLPRRLWLDCLMTILTARFLRSSSMAAKFSNSWGDGLLAIFPIGNDRDPAEVCARALASAYEARGNVAALNRSIRNEVGGVRFGLALHVGDVLYGNIGGGNRLDFTCIGAAVNLAARLEKLAGKLGRVILASDEFARYCQSDFQPIGSFPFAGFAAQQTVFGLPDEERDSVERPIGNGVFRQRGTGGQQTQIRT